jgi:wyosine [tRNA(Phe)-imidazoG37] synthetase (radical SAM superfamily)
MSLGIDPVPLKTCNFSCIYCQLGRTSRMTMKRRPFFGVTEVVGEVATALARRQPADIDWVTLVGSGETTLCSRLGSLLYFVKRLSDLPVAVITNGSLLHLAKVRAELADADAVLPSLDAGTEELFRRINRPHRDLRFADHVDGLVELRKSYRGKLWVEVMLVGGVNDSTNALNDLAAVLERVEPDEIHLSTPIRPPAESWVRLPKADGLNRAETILGRSAKVIRPVVTEGDPEIEGDLVDGILRVVSRHPLQEIELQRMLTRWVRGRVDETLAALVESGEIKTVKRLGRRFWCAANTVFPEEPEWPRRPAESGSPGHATMSQESSRRSRQSGLLGYPH